MKWGICSVCQSKQPLEHSFLPRQEEHSRGMEDSDINMNYGESINYVVDNHNYYGVRCEGSGQIPQVVLDD